MRLSLPPTLSSRKATPPQYFFHSLSLISSCPHGGNREEAVPPLTRPRGGAKPVTLPGACRLLGWRHRSARAVARGRQEQCPCADGRGCVAPGCTRVVTKGPGAHPCAGLAACSRRRPAFEAGGSAPSRGPTAAPVVGGWQPGSERAARPRPRATHLQMGGGQGRSHVHGAWCTGTRVQTIFSTISARILWCLE